jgi:hypothetical protein
VSAPRWLLGLVLLAGCAAAPTGPGDAPDRDLSASEGLESAPLAGWVYPVDRLAPAIRARRGNAVQPGDAVPEDLGDVQCAAYGRDGHVTRLVVWAHHPGAEAVIPNTPGQVDTGLGHPVYVRSGAVVFVREDGRQWVRDVEPAALEAILWKHFEKIPVEARARVLDLGTLEAVLREVGMPEQALYALPAFEARNE